jgi:hypothetical protein
MSRAFTSHVHTSHDVYVLLCCPAPIGEAGNTRAGRTHKNKEQWDDDASDFRRPQAAIHGASGPLWQGAFVDYLAAAPAGSTCPCLVRSDIGNTPTKPSRAWTSICVASAQTVSLDPTSGLGLLADRILEATVAHRDNNEGYREMIKRC